MKNILNLMALFAFVLCCVSCDDDEKAEIPTLPVTAANLNGTWQLAEWNGQPMTEGTYCYITFNRRELTFEMYQSSIACMHAILLVVSVLKMILIWDMLSVENMILVMGTGITIILSPICWNPVL